MESGIRLVIKPLVSQELATKCCRDDSPIWGSRFPRCVKPVAPALIGPREGAPPVAISVAETHLDPEGRRRVR